MDRERRFLLPNHLTTGFLDRLAAKRRDEAWLAARLEDERTRFVPVWQDQNLFTFTTGPVAPAYLAPADVRDAALAIDDAILLGARGDDVYFAIGLPDDAPIDRLAQFGRFQNVRRVAALLDEQDCALMALAKAMVYWHHRHRFCGNCSSPTESREAGHVRACTDPQCGQPHFPRTDPAIIVLVTSGERCLLGRRPGWPEGMHSTIAGFVEPGESLEQAVAREVREETGVDVEDVRYHSSQPWPFPSSLMLGFTAHAASDTIQIDEEELEHAGWFTREEIRSGLRDGSFRLPSSISIARRLIRDWFDAGSLGPLEELEENEQ